MVIASCFVGKTMRKGEMMKRRVRAVMVCSMALMLVAGMVSFADAGGTMNWKVTVKNTSEGIAQVTLYYGRGGEHTKVYRIPVGESYTFETGSGCPVELRAWIEGPGDRTNRMCMDGHEANYECTAVCADSSWNFVLLGGRAQYGGYYHFRKE
jgi:hypothetical protein